jgi:hypothetical protein
VDRPGVQKPLDPRTPPFVRFYHRRHDLLRDARAVADVAVLRSFPSMFVQAPPGLCAELTEQRGRRLVHLVNYRDNQPAGAVEVRLQLPPGKRVKSVVLASPEHEQDQPVTFQADGSCVLFTVPKVNVYEIAVVALQ